MSAAASATPGPEAPPRHGRRWPRVVRWTAGVAAALALLGAGTAALAVYWAHAALPQVDGESRLPGLSAPSTVRRDALGVPHITADSAADAVRAQGYVAAQDRLWHMDLLRRRARGELAEAFGAAALRLDEDARTLGLGRAAERTLDLLPAEARTLVEAYAAGVNAYLDTDPPLPLEFRLLRYEPRAWTPADTLAVGKLLAHDLARGWEAEARLALLKERLPPAVFEFLHPARFPGERLLFAPDSTGAAEPQGTTSDLVGARGSNNWVISGVHTATGRPLLANDPHLALGVPSIWMAVHLSAPGLEVAGVTLPGTPGVILGRNRRLAWGCTNVEDDSADLYRLVGSPERPDHYRTPDGWERFERREERIRVRRGPLSSEWDSVTHVVRSTRWGPVTEIAGRLYALQWTALQDAVELTAFLGMNRASSWAEFREALRLFPGPSQNFVYADVDGHIAWYSAGRLPIRRGGGGAVPHEPDSPAGEWLGFVPFEELPHVVDPPSGRIVTANNRLVGSSYPHRVTRGGIAPWRAAAIYERLESRGGWTTDDFVSLQGERLSPPHRHLARALLAAAARNPGDAALQEARRELEGWDGRLEPESRAAALVVSAFTHLGERVVAPKVTGAPFAAALTRRAAVVDRLVREQPADWLPDGAAGWDAVLRASWVAAGEELAAELGADRGGWTLGRLNRVRIRHPMSGAVPPLARWLDARPLELGGASSTPNVLHVGRRPGAVEGPSMRFIANMADPDDTRLVNFMGQSGHPASDHYDDQLEAWAGVGTHRLAFTPEAVARATRHTLTLVP